MLPRLTPAGPRRAAEARTPAGAPLARRLETPAPRAARRRDVHVVRLYVPRVAPALRHQAGLRQRPGQQAPAARDELAAAAERPAAPARLRRGGHDRHYDRLARAARLGPLAGHAD